MEAIAPKAGNVYPGRSFDDLSVEHFLIAAEIAARQLGDSSRSFSQRILAAVTETKRETGTNVNLGILLLLGPLVAADELEPGGDWTDSIASVLSEIEPAESRVLFRAISTASAGGLGKVDSMDVNDANSHDDILAAMRLRSLTTESPANMPADSPICGTMSCRSCTIRSTSSPTCCAAFRSLTFACWRNGPIH